MNNLQTLPRFLLPRLSWQTPATASDCTFRPASLLLRPSKRPHIQERREPQQQSWAGPKRLLHTHNEGQRAHAIGFQSHRLARQPTASPKPRIPSSGRAFHASPPRRKDHHFDTLKLVQRLQSEGFTETQAEAMMKILNDVIEESIQNLTRTMVPREDAAKATYTQKVDFAKLRSELLSTDNTETNTTRAAHERLTNDIAKLSSRLRDEIGRTQASVRLDLNLEKGRIREEAVSQELKIKETETKIEQEAAALRQQLEQVKFQTLQWLMGLCTGFAALMLGLWRLLM
ncbi:hypothetical protein MCOR27_003576 [Pyricularia oryzae]|uniref:DUF1640-domain-containing protein n=1 Tax=Pyricularia grisea TaxID=148305 RepID=A0ABQ8NMT5_PYRGI|nr:hypothetical protein MCOR01_001701 [Pyricularia oryzae]KAI6298186.1 hypothetical protein MCOR33_005645 [Pyricularia grisea]KAH9429730.1 hypothetical protein MCOR02_009467 [Pyricularia oryzae]KAI6263074.1 hypothetical protein MCOR19_000714 [Pyricularia oryzae]KAI6277344.1 hypothetical protein MCOR26_005159 [Pyricularia oryzae]